MEIRVRDDPRDDRRFLPGWTDEAETLQADA